MKILGRHPALPLQQKRMMHNSPILLLSHEKHINPSHTPVLRILWKTLHSTVHMSTVHAGRFLNMCYIQWTSDDGSPLKSLIVLSFKSRVLSTVALWTFDASSVKPHMRGNSCRGVRGAESSPESEYCSRNDLQREKDVELLNGTLSFGLVNVTKSNLQY